MNVIDFQSKLENDCQEAHVEIWKDVNNLGQQFSYSGKIKDIPEHLLTHEIVTFGFRMLPFQIILTINY